MNCKNNPILANKNNVRLSLTASATAVMLSLTFSANAFEEVRSYTMSPPSQQLSQLQVISTSTNNMMQKQQRKSQIQQQQSSMSTELSKIGGKITGGLSLLAPISFVEMTPTQAQIMRDKGYTVAEDHVVEMIDALPAEQQQADNKPWGVEKIRSHEVWAEGATGSNISICIIDGGIEASHSDFGNKVIAQNPWGGPLSAGLHGTHVAGTAGALDNNGGVVGVAPEANLIDADVFNGAFVQQSTFMEAVEWCVDQGSRVINMSYGDPTATNPNYGMVHQAAYDAGTILIAAAGNDSNGKDPLYPAAFDSVIAVNQSNSSDSLTGVGQNGELTAPGHGTYSTVLNNGYKTLSGTSMASPHVAGAAALLFSAKNDATPSEVREALVNTAVNIGSSSMAGAGRIDVMEAYLYLTGGPGNPRPEAEFSESCTELSCDFDASASTDSNGTIENYSWDFGDGSTGSGVNPSHSYAIDDNYTVTLTVTDNEDATGTTAHNVRVGEPVDENQLTDIDSRTVSTMPKDDWLRYYFDNDGSYDRFTVTTSADNGDLDLYVLFEAEPDTNTHDCKDDSADSNETCTIENMQQGRYHIGVKAWAATNNITVNFHAENDDPIDPTPPTASFTENCSDLACNFDSNGSTDPDGDIVSYNWNFGDNSSDNTANPSHSYSAAGTYTVTLTVTDSEGAADSATHTVTVEGDITVPGICSDVSPWSSSASYSQGDQVTFGGHLYEKNFWFGNTQPGTGGAFSKWNDLGPCSS
ncbi:S8 family serine peptidase [Colwellia psychrerythraea]|uniref:Subtilisin, Microbial collagenase n=1 Tax=Colwellia psychrerythraea TaxID=28229 RepID=A0A099KWG1_COLPS|nr:S8 family serine peptidase [Colwellia psychrerythraea]KGJ95074.1 Subtilisin, Microbial collagenase [Colwellia psychrerythraea]